MAKKSTPTAPRTIRKITLGNCGAQPTKGSVKEAEDRLFVLALIGDYKEGNTQYGDYVAFLGQFLAVNLATGEQFRASKAIFPGIVEEMLLTQVKQTIASGGVLQTRFNIGVEPSEKGSMGFAYNCVILDDGEDALAGLIAESREQGLLPA